MVSSAGMKYGTHPDVPDGRDHEYASPGGAIRLPRRVDLTSSCPPVYDQGKTLNSCSANAIGAALWYLERRRSRRAPSPSRLFLYYNERAREHLAGTNAPVSLRSGYKSVAKQGICSEQLWPYRDERFAVQPPPACYAAALEHRALRYARLRRELRTLRHCLAEGFPFTVGLSVYASFESAAVARSGVVPLPRPHERQLGGHAVLVVGYDDETHRFIVRNSAGPHWGERGYCRMPYAYLLDENLAWDFWTVRREG